MVFELSDRDNTKKQCCDKKIPSNIIFELTTDFTLKHYKLKTPYHLVHFLLLVFEFLFFCRICLSVLELHL